MTTIAATHLRAVVGGYVQNGPYGPTAAQESDVVCHGDIPSLAMGTADQRRSPHGSIHHYRLENGQYMAFAGKGSFSVDAHDVPEKVRVWLRNKKCP